MSGAILDVTVDIRPGSSTYGQHVAVRLDAEQFFIPHGFTRGFCMLTPKAIIDFKVDSCHSPPQDRSIRRNNPDFATLWPFDETQAVFSNEVSCCKDANATLIRQILPQSARANIS